GARSELLAGIALVPDVQLGPPGPGLDVDARAERPLTVGPQHCDVDVVRVTHGRPRGLHLVAHRLGERVELIGSVERDRGDVIRHVELDRLERRWIRVRAGHEPTLRASTIGFPGQAEHALSEDVALDLMRSTCDARLPARVQVVTDDVAVTFTRIPC